MLPRSIARAALRPRLIALLTAAVLAVPLVSLTVAPPASATVPVLHYTGGMPKAIEPLADYVGQTSCHPGYLPGTAALGHLLVTTYRNTSFGGAYPCGYDGSKSEHYDGRAVDWMNSVRNPTQAAQAAAVISFLLATDKAGNKFAMARRMGVMYIIWNNKMWGSWSGAWEPYNNCAKTPSPSLDSACHRNHMHISLSWDGAYARTSFWSHRAYPATDFGPCRPRDLSWAADYSGFNSKPCPNYPGLGVPAHSSAAFIALETYSGAVMYPGMTGGPIQAVQRAFGLPVTGRYDVRTMSLVRWFRTVHHLSASYTIDAPTWRTLLWAYHPR